VGCTVIGRRGLYSPRQTRAVQSSADAGCTVIGRRGLYSPRQTRAVQSSYLYDALAALAERLGCPSWGGWVNKVQYQVIDSDRRNAGCTVIVLVCGARGVGRAAWLNKEVIDSDRRSAIVKRSYAHGAWRSLAGGRLEPGNPGSGGLRVEGRGRSRV
jgi:hypothetical protein